MSGSDRLAVRPQDAAERVFSTLSGGNQQKVVLARWMRCGAQVLALDEPTQGVDVAAKTMIYQALTAAARQGTSVIVASSDSEELARLCDRVVVLRDGQVTAELHGSALTAEAITQQAWPRRWSHQRACERMSEHSAPANAAESGSEEGSSASPSRRSIPPTTRYPASRPRRAGASRSGWASTASAASTSGPCSS